MTSLYGPAEDTGASATPSGSRASMEPASSLHPTGFDPSRSKAEKFAASLDAWVSLKLLPGLLPETATNAAALLREQEKQLAELRAALATKDHLVTAKVTGRDYRKEIRGEFVITDPRIYFGEITVDAFMLEQRDQRWVEHVTRDLVNVATRDWLRDLHEKAFAAVSEALASGMETRQGQDRETGLGAEHDSPTRQGDAQSQPLGNPLDTGDGK